ncbi:hypothetical protein [Variovorax sp. PBL-E5]|uniref:hypothetical protein n=1 Tax=Variovorax sp. PBL-E5 TaxID=434014 RepID=UPI001315D54E|nr:hypothetical protein [Variovorax sp. PBL-E5]VTU45101.1 Stage 0 sporulation protein KE [Variovorax sp. PBL-E5]
MQANARQMREFRRRIQSVFQDPYASLNPRRGIRQALSEPLHVHRLGSPAEIEAKVRSTILEVGLTVAVLDKYPHEFSGGQRQRGGPER